MILAPTASRVPPTSVDAPPPTTIAPAAIEPPAASSASTRPAEPLVEGPSNRASSAESTARPPFVARDRDARLVSSVEPFYPDAARMSKLTGVVEVDIVIGDTGKVTSAKAVSGHPIFRRTAEDAVRQWRFEPALVDGKPAASRRRVRIAFN